MSLFTHYEKPSTIWLIHGFITIPINALYFEGCRLKKRDWVKYTSGKLIYILFLENVICIALFAKRSTDLFECV